jgi:PAS domain S-box-containing protein
MGKGRLLSSVLDADVAQAGEFADKPGTWEPTRDFLKASIFFMLVGTGLFEVLLFVQGQGFTRRALIVSTLIVLGCVGWVFLRRDRITRGLLVLGTGVWIYLAAAAFAMGGVTSISMSVFPLPVLLAGWLCGSRVAMQLAVLSGTIGLALVIGEAQGWLPQPPSTSPLLRWFVHASVYVFVAFLASSVFSSYAARLADVRRLGRALARRTAELESREADLNRAQAVASIGSWTYDLESDRMQLSAETCRIFGLAEGTEGSHDTYLSFVHDDERDAVIAAWDAALAGGASFDHEHRIVTGNGERWVRQQAELQRDANDRVVRAVGTTQDVTQRKQHAAAMQAARDQLAATLDAIPDLLFEVDIDGRYLDYHSPNAELLAAPRDHLIGRTVSEVLPASVAGICLAAIQEAHVTGRSHGRSFELELSQGRTWFELSVARKPVPVGDMPRFIVISRDITKRKRAEAEIMAFNATLEARVRERTVELEKANRELESFSYTISHDLRAPLRSMVGFSGMLLEDLGDKLDHDSRDLLWRISTSGTRMSRLIDGVLEYSRLAKSEIVRRDVDLDALVGEVVADLRERIPHVEVVTGSLGTALADPVMVRQIFHNLIENAIKFSTGAVTPRVAIGSESADGSRWYFVRDNGMGFDMQHAEHLFSLFTRLHSDPDIDSTGAGLAIVKRLVERHGGAIRAEATPGQGATFRFHL